MKTIIFLLVLLAAMWYFLSPLFIDETVDEAFPEAEISTQTEQEVEAMSDVEKEAVETKVLEQFAAMPDTVMEDEMPERAQEPLALASGMFVDADSFHKGDGSATVYALEDESRVLRRENFEVTNGPQLHVLLAKDPENLTPDTYVDLGELKGNKGDQNYVIPPEAELPQISSVVIYCKPFSVVFSTANLE